MKSYEFYRKTYGRIFVAREEDIPIVLQAIEETAPQEVSYMPKDLVAVYLPGGRNTLVYLHKFEADKTKLTHACITKGVWIWCVDGEADEFSFAELE